MEAAAPGRSVRALGYAPLEMARQCVPRFLRNLMVVAGFQTENGRGAAASSECRKLACCLQRPSFRDLGVADHLPFRRHFEAGALLAAITSCRLGNREEFHPPPSASISRTLAVRRRESSWIAFL